MTAYRPYWAPLAGSFRRVFGQLGLPWSEHRTRAMAILFAAGGGAFGLQYFYLGNRRRGWYSLAFFWTAVPFVLGFRDAIRWMLISEQEFALRFIPHMAPEEDETEPNEEQSPVPSFH